MRTFGIFFSNFTLCITLLIIVDLSHQRILEFILLPDIFDLWPTSPKSPQSPGYIATSLSSSIGWCNVVWISHISEHMKFVTRILFLRLNIFVTFPSVMVSVVGHIVYAHILDTVSMQQWPWQCMHLFDIISSFQVYTWLDHLVIVFVVFSNCWYIYLSSQFWILEKQGQGASRATLWNISLRVSSHCCSLLLLDF